MNITATTKICLVIGDPVNHSLSPQMHNTAYAALGIDDKFIHLAAEIKIENIGEIVKAVRLLKIRGLTCTIPHKITIMKYLDKIDGVAKKIGAANSIVNNNGVLTGFNTDWVGVSKSFENVTRVKNKKAAVIGSGGAARAFIYALTVGGAKVTVFTRNIKNVKSLSDEFGVKIKSFEQISEIVDEEIVCNATPVGMYPKIDDSIIPKEYIKRNHIIFDAVYNPFETKLLKESLDKGATIIHGYKMLLFEAAEKFKLYTGYDAPIDVMENELLKNLQNL